MLKKIKLKSIRLLRNIYAGIICPQFCLFCGCKSGTGIPLCKNCLQKELFEPVLFQLKNPANFCIFCGKVLISEKDYCTNCRAKIKTEKHNLEKIYSANSILIKNGLINRIFTLYPYQGRGGELLRLWKNQNMRGFAEIYAEALSFFIKEKKELKNIPIVPVPPRPQKMKTKGWDQIEDLSFFLEHIYGFQILRCLQRKDGVSQKTLSREKRMTNLKGKIVLKKKHIFSKLEFELPEKLIILDDVMTTGATLNSCTKVLKDSGCKEVIGLCLFFD